MTKNYVVVGNPIEQSKSPLIHSLFAEQTGEDIYYTKQLVDEGNFEKFADAFFANADNHGMNITMPFKGDAFSYADSLSSTAELAGAVNTLVKQSNGMILGENTDGLGLVSHIKEYLGWELKSKSILVLGAGGAVRGVLLPLLNAQPKHVRIANRTESKAKTLAEKFDKFGSIDASSFSALAGLKPFDMIINGTSTGLTGDVPPIPTSLIDENTHVYDMVYSSNLTPFLAFAKKYGATHLSDGLGMLVGQAAISFNLWRGIMPDVSIVMKKIKSI